MICRQERGGEVQVPDKDAVPMEEEEEEEYCIKLISC